MFRGHVEVVVGVVTAGEGVEAAAVLTQELAVLVLVREPVRAEEEHVLAEVRQPRQLARVGHVADVNIQGRSRLVSGLVRYQENLHTVTVKHDLLGHSAVQMFSLFSP